MEITPGVVQLIGRLKLKFYMYVIVKMTSCNNEQLYYDSNMYLECIKVFVKLRNMFIDNYALVLMYSVLCRS